MKLWFAAHQGDRAEVARLLKRKQTPRALSEALISACIADSADIAKDLLAAGADPNSVTDGELTALRLAARRSLPIVQALLQRGADPNLIPSACEDGRSPIADSDSPTIVTVLAAAGADVNLPDSKGQTPLIRAISRRERSLAEALLKAGADPNRPDRNGNTPLYHALAAEIRADQRDPDSSYLPTILRRHGARPENMRPLLLFLAVADVDQARVYELLQAGTNPNRRTDHGSTSLCLAAELNQVDIAQMLIKAGADPNLADGAGMTPLMIAARGDSFVRRGYSDMVKLLLAAGADPTSTHVDGNGDLRDAASYAREHSRQDILDLLPATQRLPSPPLPGLQTTEGEQFVMGLMAPIDAVEDSLCRLVPKTNVTRNVLAAAIELPDHPWQVLQYTSSPWTIIANLLCRATPERDERLLGTLLADLRVQGFSLYLLEEPFVIAWRLHDGVSLVESLDVVSEDVYGPSLAIRSLPPEKRRFYERVREGKGLLWMSKQRAKPPSRRTALHFVSSRVASLGIHIPDLNAGFEPRSPGDLHDFTRPDLDPAHILRMDLVAVGPEPPTRK